MRPKTKTMEDDEPAVDEDPRFAFIEQQLHWYGTVTRADLCDAFSIEDATAKDWLEKYRKARPGRLVSVSGKGYRAAEDFTLPPERIDAAAFLSRFAADAGIVAPIVERAERDHLKSKKLTRRAVPVLGPPEPETRSVQAEVLRAVLHAILRGQELQVVYRSPGRALPREIWIAPHALSTDSFRWAVRAKDCERGRYIDYVLHRIERVVAKRDGQGNASSGDAAWRETVTVKLKPRDGLEPQARQAIEAQYGMKAGICSVQVPRAMLLYFLKRHQLEEDSAQKAPHQHPLQIANRDEVTAALDPSVRVPPRQMANVAPDEAQSKQKMSFLRS